MESRQDIVGRLGSAWQRERLYFGSRGFFHLVVWSIIVLACDFALDFLLLLPGRARLLLLGANAAFLMVVLYLTWLRRLRAYDALRVARQVESLYPQLGSILVSYVQFSGGATDDMASPSLIEAMRRQAVEQSIPLDFGKIVRFRRLRRICLMAGVAMLLVAAAGYVWPVHLQVFMVRIGNPDMDVRYPTQTVIDTFASSGAMVVQQGRTVTMRAVVGGVIPENVRLMIIPDQGRAETVTIPVTAGAGSGRAEFSYRVEDVYRGFSYVFRAGDDMSGRHSVEVVPPPVVEPRVEIRYPAYCGRKPAIA